MSQQRRKQQLANRNKLVKEANEKHDKEHGINASSPNYYKTYIQGTGLRNSK